MSELQMIQITPRHYRLAVLRAWLLVADIAVLAAQIGIVLLIGSLLTGWQWLSGLVDQAILRIEVINPPEFLVLLVPICGISWIFSRIRARSGEPSSTLKLPINFLHSAILSRLAATAAAFLAIATGFDEGVFAAAGFFAGVMAASGAGAALRARVVGMVNERSQLLIAALTLAALALAAWLASWANFSAFGLVTSGP